MSPYGTKIPFFGKSVSDNFFHLQNMFHNISRWLKPKNRQKFFRTIFSKKFTSYCPPMGPKFQFLWKVFPINFFTLWSQKIDKNFFEPFFQKILQVIVPLWDQNFNFCEKCFRQIFSLTEYVSQHFTLIEAKKLTKIFSNHFFKIFYKLLSPYGTKNFIFEKSFSDNFFHLQNMFHNISRWLKPKNRQKFFRTIFSKKFTSYCPPMGPKFQFLWKVFPINFFTLWSQKIDKNFFEPFFQKSLQVIVPLWDQNFNFWKKCVRQFFSLTKQVSEHFTLIEAKKSTNIFSNHFFKKFYKLLSPYGTKISIFVKSVSDKFFHSPNMFHNISRWLKTKNRQKIFRTIFSINFTSYCPPMGPKISFLKKVFPTIFFTYKTSFTTFHVDWSQKIDKNCFRTIFSKNFTSYCPPMGPKISFLKKVFPTIFFTYKTSFTTFHVDWSQKIDKNFFEPFFQKSLQVIVPLWDQNFNFCKK